MSYSFLKTFSSDSNMQLCNKPEVNIFYRSGNPKMYVGLPITANEMVWSKLAKLALPFH